MSYRQFLVICLELIRVAVQDPIPVEELGEDADALRVRVRERYQALLGGAGG